MFGCVRKVVDSLDFIINIPANVIYEKLVGCNLIGVIPVLRRFVVFPDAQSHQPVLSLASIATSKCLISLRQSHAKSAK